MSGSQTVEGEGGYFDQCIGIDTKYWTLDILLLYTKQTYHNFRESCMVGVPYCL